MNDDRFRWDFGPVPADEIAFAMSLFLAAAHVKSCPRRDPQLKPSLPTGRKLNVCS
jgi:hypothetical protein